MERCTLCPGVNNCVPGDYPECNGYILGVLFIGEAPGKDENKQGRVFIGKTGREVNEHYLPLAGLKRSNVSFTNAIKCLPVGHGGRLQLDRIKDVDLLMSCASSHLVYEMEQSNARVIVPMGAFACYAIDPDINLELQHGIPLETSWGTVFPMFHPAGGIHEPKKMLLIRNDWVRLGKFLKDKLKPTVDEYPKPNYASIEPGEAIEPDYMDSLGGTFLGPLACDTEITRNREPFCLTFSMSPGYGRLIRADDKDSLAIFQHWLDCWEGPILFHNWLFDQSVVEAMGLKFPQHLIVDTMVRAYHLGNIPQGLKTLAYRLLGMKMEDFDDLVTPYSVPLCLDYLREAREKDWPQSEESVVRDELGQWKLYKPQSMSTKLKRFFTDLGNNPAKDIFKSWDNWEDTHQLIEGVMGRPWPGKDIRHAPFGKVIHYASRDADATLRLWHVQQSMTRQVRRKLQEYWQDGV